MFVKALDVSRYQGLIDWTQVKGAGYEIAVIKMTGGDDGLYLDSKANQNYYAAQRADLALGMYHFAGGTDPVAEADYFITACSPLADNDVLVLDWEVQHENPVQWCLDFITHVHDRTGVWPIIYMNGSTRNAYDWAPVTQNCGVWIAWYGRDPEGDLPVSGSYLMHQYSSTGSVAGIAGNVDLDAWYESVDVFKAYGFHTQPPAAPAPEPAPILPPTVETPPAAPTEVPLPHLVNNVPTPPKPVVKPVIKPIVKPIAKPVPRKWWLILLHLILRRKA